VTVLAPAPPIAWHRSRLLLGLALARGAIDYGIRLGLAAAIAAGCAELQPRVGWLAGRFWQRSLETFVGVALALVFGALIPYAGHRLRSTGTPVHT